MSEDGGDIEYLDEDEDLVQQYVHSANTQIEVKLMPMKKTYLANQSLLVERRPAQKRKQKQNTTDSDSDYDPLEDLQFLENEKKKKAMKRSARVVAVKPGQSSVASKEIATRVQQSIKIDSNQQKVLPKFNQPAKDEIDINDIVQRRKLDIKIPDYEDALCLPAKAWKRDHNDYSRLKAWNDLCLNHVKTGEAALTFENTKVTSSNRSVVFRNVRNKQGTLETTILGKIIINNQRGVKKTECFQSVLPKYRERNPLPSYSLVSAAKKVFKHTNEVLLNVVNDNEDKLLVAYKPKEAVSAIYRLFGKKNDVECLEEGEGNMSVMREVTCCKVCAQCYQMSSRLQLNNDKKEKISCSVCSRSYVSVYNLLSHLKTHHSNEQVRARVKQISKALAQMVQYHYKCRVCGVNFDTIKVLRKHVVTHKALKPFRCEVGDHVTQ